MLKKLGLRKIAVTTSALFVIGLLYLFPSANTLEIGKNISYVEESDYSPVYLLDNYNYVSEVNAIVSESELEDRLKKKIELITVNTSDGKIPKGFRPIIPEGTTLKSLEIEESTVTVNFSKEMLSVSSLNEEKMIEAIVYTLTSEEGIDKVVIKVEDKVLNKLPNSQKLVPSPIDRTYGINKDYDINSLYGLTKTTIYYTSNYDDMTYYVPVTKISNSNEEKVTVIVNELKSSLLYQSNLSSYLSSSAELKKYEELEGVMNLTFNDKIFDSIYDQNILEEVVYTIGMSVKENYDVSKVAFYVEDKEILVFE